MNPVTQYYVSQAGSGIAGFQGIRYQRGSGFWGNIWSKVGLPVLKFLGKQAATTGLNVASDLLEGKSFKESAKSGLRKGGRNTVDYMKGMMDQEGSGRKRRRRRSNSKKTIKRRKIVPTKVVKKRKPRRKHRKKNKFIF